jgi:phage gp46-like protein
LLGESDTDLAEDLEPKGVGDHLASEWIIAVLTNVKHKNSPWPDKLDDSCVGSVAALRLFQRARH